MGVPSGGGQNLGQAQGRIVIDTSGVRRAQGEVQNASKIMGDAFGALGVAYGAAQISRFTVDSLRLATSYERQSVAARSLADGQGRLNELLAIYDRVTGGAIDKASALSDVTRLMAVGFADTSEELERFATAARGISVATGQQQDYVISQLQLAIANQSTLRLDQLGLGVAEVKQRIDELKASNSGLTTEMAYQQAILELADEKFGDLTRSSVAAATGLEEFVKAWKEFRLSFGQGATGPANLIFSQWAKDLEDMNQQMQQFTRFLRGVEMAGKVFRFEIGLSNAPTGMAGPPIGPQMRPPGALAGPRLTPITPRFDEEQTDAIVEWNRARIDIERQAGEQISETSAQYASQRAATLRQYEQTIAREAEDFASQRARAIASHERAIADVHEAAALHAARQAEDLARTIADARANSGERIADWQEDLDRTLAERRQESAERLADWQADRDEAIVERRQESAKRLAEIETDFARDRERAAQQSRDTILSAAARLDARAVWEEQRRFARENEQAIEAHEERVSDEKKKLDEAIDNLNKAHEERLVDERTALDKSIRQSNQAHQRRLEDEREALDKRIADANEAYQRQLEDARAADAQRLEDMQADFAQRLLEEDADRATRLARMAVDHQEQLTEQDRAHGERIAQIERHAAAERKQLDADFNEQLKDLKLHNPKWLAEQRRLQADSLKVFDEWWAEINKRFKGEVQGPTAPGLNPSLNPRRAQLEGTLKQLYAESGTVPINSPRHTELRKQIELLEEELRKLKAGAPGTAATSMMGASAMLASGASFAMPVAAAASASGGAGRGVSIGQLNPTIVLGDIGNRSNGEIRALIESTLLDVVRKAASAA